MSETVYFLNEIIDLNKIVAPVLTILLIVAALWLRIRRRALLWQRKPIAVALLACLASLAYAIGAGSCVLGGLLQGSAICTFRPRYGPDLDAVADFLEIQAIYLVVFLLTFFLAALFALALVPGNRDPWQRFIFLVTLGKRGGWHAVEPMTANAGGKPDEREERLLKAIGEVADPKVRGQMLASAEEARRRMEQAKRLLQEMEHSMPVLERDAIRGVRLLNWIVAITFPIFSVGSSIPLVVGALTRQTFALGHTPVMVSLEMEPALFWVSMVSSALLSGVSGLGAAHAIRTLRSTTLRPNPTVDADARNSGARGSP